LKISVIITTFNDRQRLKRAFKSLLNQTRQPDEIIIADGGSTDGTIELARELEREYGNVKLICAPGNIAETRRQVLASLKTDVAVFLDADEVAPEGWLQFLIAPIEHGDADFTGGPTRPFSEAKSRAEEYVNLYDEWFYREVVAKDISMLPMGNSAWKMEVFEALGGIPKGLKFNAEDYDINQRAISMGFRGKLVQEAWVYHDQSSLNTLWKVLRRKYRYNTGAAYTYLRNKTLRKKMRQAARPVREFKHTYEIFDIFIKPIALLRAIIAYKVGW